MSRYDDVCAQLRANPRRWLVTGAAGFIGSALVEKLVQLGQSVIGLDNLITGSRDNLSAFAGKIEFIEGDLCDADACKQVCRGVDYVLHEAALGSVPRSIEDPISTHRSNVDGFLNIALAARDAKARRFVYASSSSVYGDDEGLPKNEERIGRALSPYAVSKRVDELYAMIIQDSYGLETIGLRYFNVFGRRQDPAGPYAAVIARWTDLLADGQPCVIYGDGRNSRDFCYVDNVVQANLLAATCDASATNDVYNVGCGGRTDLRELFELIRGQVARRHPAAAAIQPIYEPARFGDIPHSQANVDKLVRTLGYVPTHDVAAGMAETVDWFLSRRARK